MLGEECNRLLLRGSPGYVSLPTTICLTLVCSSTVRAKLFIPLHIFHLALHSFSHEVLGKERNILYQLMGRHRAW